jgi:threonine/homoserine/homoserine lactone efflux protein
MWAADACVVIGAALLVAGVYWNWGEGWALIAGGAGLLWIGWRAYRAPTRKRQADDETL